MKEATHFLGTRAYCLHLAVPIAALMSAMFTIALLSQGALASDVEDVYDRVKHDYADSNGVKIHYALLGPTSPPTSAMPR